MKAGQHIIITLNLNNVYFGQSCEKTSTNCYSTGGGATSVLGSVAIAVSGEPVKGVTFTFVAENNGMMKSQSTETTKPIVKKSADKGKFRVTLPENMYRVIVEKIGYKKQKVIVTLVNGETTNLNIELEKN